MIIKCPECGHQVSDQARTCPSCGIDIAGKVTRCPDCGEVIFKEQAECPNCHCQINGVAPSVPAPLLTIPADDQPEESLPAPEQDQQPTRKKPKKRKASYAALSVAFVIALIVVFLGYYFYQVTERDNELRAYENAVQSDQPAVLQNFLDMFGNQAPRAHCDTIQAHLKALKQLDIDWENAVASGLKAEIEKYMKLHPNSIHKVEANLRIDSIDWLAACQADTPESYQAYLAAHPDGTYLDEARNAFEALDAQQVKPEDKTMISELFTIYFTALANSDEPALTQTLANIMTSFLHKEGATKADVIQYMEKLHETDITKMDFTMNNDWKIEKQQESEGLYTYSVDFSVDQKMERSDDSKERFVTYKVQATVSPDCKISSLNMKKIVK